MAAVATVVAVAPRTRQPAMGTAERREPVAVAEAEEVYSYLLFRIRNVNCTITQFYVCFI